MRRSAVLFLAGMAMIFVLQARAWAQDLPPAVIAVLDFKAVMSEAAAAQDIRRQLQVYRERYQQEINLQEEALRAEGQSLQQQQAILTPAAFEEKYRAFDKKTLEMRRQWEDKARNLDRSFNAAMGEIQKAVVPIVEELTQARGFNIVVDSSQVLFAKKALDITPIVVEELNARLPAVQVPPPPQ